MIRLLIPIVFLLIGIGGGVAAGLFMTPEDEGENYDAELSEQDTSATEENDTSEEGSYDDEPRVTPGSAENLEYVRLNNQFIVPIVNNGSVRSLVVMSLTLEISAGENQLVFDREPRIRDAFLRVMFSHANSGGFDDVFTSSLALGPLRRGLRDAAVEILGPVVNDVLIVDIVRQDA